MATYGSKITELRKKNNLTQAELGAKLNISAQAVSKWEKELSEPDIETLRKMSEIFNVSLDELLKAEEKAFIENNEEEPAEEQPVAPKIINGYCENCKKPVGPGEYQISHFTYNPKALTNKVTASTSQHIYCNDCNKEVLKTKQEEDKKRALAQIYAEKQENKSELKKGLLWGILFAGIFLIICLAGIGKFPIGEWIGITVFLVYGSYSFSALMFWDCYVADVFDWFCHSFKAPFGLIFELSLDGIIWLLTVKLALWIICSILSILLFLVGLVVCTALSIVSFPFLLAYKIKLAR